MCDHLDWQSADELGLDVGDVCSDKSVEARQTFLTAVPGAFTFIFFYLSRYPRRLGFYSRVDHPENKMWIDKNGRRKWHWVVRFVRSMGAFDLGLTEDDGTLVKTKWEKGRYAPSSEVLWTTNMRT